MKKSLIVSSLSLITLYSCGTTETFETKMMRYTPKTLGQNQVPEFSTEGFVLSTPTSKAGRMPASVKPIPTESITEDTKLSNKKLYFLSLYGQYESLKKYGESFNGPKVEICPSFHTSLIEHNDKKASMKEITEVQSKTRRFSYDTSRFNDNVYVAQNPELLLPVVKNEVHPKVIDILKSEGEKLNPGRINEIVQNALDIHLAKTYSEIRQLCEFGVSDNYYIYENLITHIKSNEFKPVDKNLNTLLKTTLFSNMALVTSIEKNQKEVGRAIASVEKPTNGSTPYSQEVLTRLNVEWAGEYFEHIKKSR